MLFWECLGMIISKSGLVRFHLGDVQTSSFAQPCFSSFWGVLSFQSQVINHHYHPLTKNPLF